MEFKYHIENIGGSIDLIVEQNEMTSGYINNVGGWLFCDVRGHAKEYLPQIKSVIEGLTEEQIYWGNAYKAVVHKDFTKISYDYEEDNPEMVPCTLPTEMLYEILKIWIKACEEQDKDEN